jgi:hypothetical protein
MQIVSRNSRARGGAPNRKRAAIRPNSARIVDFFEQNSGEVAVILSVMGRLDLVPYMSKRPKLLHLVGFIGYNRVVDASWFLLHRYAKH